MRTIALTLTFLALWASTVVAADTVPVDLGCRLCFCSSLIAALPTPLR